jgi:hypothetical protein
MIGPFSADTLQGTMLMTAIGMVSDYAPSTGCSVPMNPEAAE